MTVQRLLGDDDYRCFAYLYISRIVAVRGPTGTLRDVEREQILAFCGVGVVAFDSLNFDARKLQGFTLQENNSKISRV